MLGCAGSVAHWLLITVFVPDFESSIAIYGKIILNTGICFIVPFGLVYGISWIVLGFKKQPRKQELRPDGNNPNGIA